jgi:hypothetical protein
MRPRKQRVRVSEQGVPSLSGAWAEEIMRLRRAMNAAVSELYADRPDDARRMLSAALAERWWK